MKLNTSQLSPGENSLAYASPRDKWVTELITRISARGYQLSTPLEIAIRLTKIEPDFYMKGSMQCSVGLECARCAENFRFPLNQRFEIAFSQSNPKSGISKFKASADSDELDINFFEGHEINLSEVLEEQFFLAIPFQAICSESCKGVCQRCGINRNTKECLCDSQAVPNHFSVLTQYKLSGGSRGSS
ncbi:MAG: DUF177 domain-containing protein [Deltaproteobacteria bacterium]|nr:DUF177 domain-containing protein [Deltaproteobacteria bacterium]MBI3293581.1 DUF177 domain-containing protein [Deltaproteobacteria bacterium]